MVLADPSRVHAELVGVQGLLRDVADELVRRPCVVFVVIVAQGEVAEFHNTPPFGSPGHGPVLVSGIIDAFATVVNAIMGMVRFGHYAPTRAPDPGWCAFDIAKAGP